MVSTVDLNTVAGLSELDALNPDHLPDEQHDFPFQFLGLVGLSESSASNRCSCDSRMLYRWYSSGHDYG